MRQVLRAELRARDRTRELALQLRAAEWFESTGDTRRATRHFLAAHQVDRALALLRDHVAIDFLHDPAPPTALDLSLVNPALLMSAPDQLLALAAHLLLWGDVIQGGAYLDQLERAQPAAAPDSRLAARLAAMQSLRHALAGDVRDAIRHAYAARSIEERALPGDEWNAAVPLILMRAHTWLEDVEAVDREAATALGMPSLAGPAELVDARGAQALAWFEAGRIADAVNAAKAADADATRLGFDQHPFAVDTCAFSRAPRSSGVTARADPFLQQLIAAALDVRATQQAQSPPHGMPAEPMTAAEQRVLKLLPTSTTRK